MEDISEQGMPVIQCKIWVAEPTSLLSQLVNSNEGKPATIHIKDSVSTNGQQRRVDQIARSWLILTSAVTLVEK